ncbi:Endonuclease/exonuclease/phosphatase [Rhypophila decipiens]
MSRNYDRISPPPLKRRKVAPSSIPTEVPTTPASASPPKRAIRLFSWNINGISPLVPSSSKKITSFFGPSQPNGNSLNNDPLNLETQGPSLRAFLRRHNWPEILFLQEIKIKQGDDKTEALLLSSLNTPLDSSDDLGEDGTRSYTLHTSLPRDKYNAKGFGGKLYGVATIIRQDFAERFVEKVRYPDWDLEGRVSIVEMKRTQNITSSRPSDIGNSGPFPRPHTEPIKPLAMMNIYAVNGTSAPYRSPKTGLVSGTRHDHKLAFHTRLRDECLDLESKGFHVVVAGDLNVARGLWDGHPKLRTFPKQHCLNRSDFNVKFFGEDDNKRAGAYLSKNDGKKGTGEKCLDAVDVYRATHGDRRKYTWISRNGEWGSSCDRVDLIFVSKGLWEAGRVVGADILDSPLERGPSDHVPIWIEINMS